MRFAHEIAAPSGLDLPGDAGLDRREIDLALQLVGTLEGPWQPEKYRDRYRDALLAAIERKLEGRAVAPAERGGRAPTKVVDLMSALEASLKAQPKREGARAPGRREPSAPRWRTSSTSAISPSIPGAARSTPSIVPTCCSSTSIPPRSPSARCATPRCWCATCSTTSASAHG